MKLLLSSLLLIVALQLNAQQTGLFRHLNTASIQTGSGVGMYTIGVGNHTWVKNIELDLMLGVVPEPENNDEKWHIFGLKGTWNSWNITKGKINVLPIRMGINLNYTLDDDFNFNNASDYRYPRNYYWWSPAFRINLFLGSSIDFRVKRSGFSLYHELGTNDLYISSYFSNNNHKVLSPTDILVWGFGLKWYLHGVSQEVD